MDNKTDFVFDKQMTTAIKGVAICIMFFHHFIGFPHWVNEGNIIYGIPFAGATLEYYLAVFGKICVAMYTFLSGYGLYISYQNKDNIWDFRYLFKKTMQLLFNWWLVVLVVEAPVILLEGLGGIRKIIGHLTLTMLDGNPFVEYLRFYLLALWTSPICYNIVKKWKNSYIFIFVLPFLGIVLRKLVILLIGENELINIYILYIPYFMTGMMFCKTKLYQKIYQILSMRQFSWLLIILGVVSTIVVRQVLGSRALSFDSWLSAALIFCIGYLFQKHRNAEKFFGKLGNYSTNLWYSHAVWIFGSVSLQKILYAPRVPVLILIWGILLCMPGAWIVSWIMKKVKI